MEGSGESGYKDLVVVIQAWGSNNLKLTAPNQTHVQQYTCTDWPPNMLITGALFRLPKGTPYMVCEKPS